MTEWTDVIVEPQYRIEDLCFWIYAGGKVDGHRYYIQYGPYLEKPTDELLECCRTFFLRAKAKGPQ